MCLRCAVGCRPPAGVRLPPQQQQEPTMLRPTVPCASMRYAGLQGCATYWAGCCCSVIAALSWPEHSAVDAFTTSTTTESFHNQPVQIHTCILIQNHTCHLTPRCYSGFLNTFCRMLLQRKQPNQFNLVCNSQYYTTPINFEHHTWKYKHFNSLRCSVTLQVVKLIR